LASHLFAFLISVAFPLTGFTPDGFDGKVEDEVEDFGTVP